MMETHPLDAYTRTSGGIQISLIQVTQPNLYVIDLTLQNISHRGVGGSGQDFGHGYPNMCATRTR